MPTRQSQPRPRQFVRVLYGLVIDPETKARRTTDSPPFRVDTRDKFWRRRLDDRSIELLSDIEE